MKNILIVDDEPFIRNFLRSMLSKLCTDAQVIEATDGNDALEKLKQYDIDLLTIDINMPFLNGLDLVKVLKENEAYKNLPLIVLTAIGTEEMIEHMRDYGVSDFIPKLEATESTSANPLVIAIKKYLG